MQSRHYNDGRGLFNRAPADGGVNRMAEELNKDFGAVASAYSKRSSDPHNSTTPAPQSRTERVAEALNELRYPEMMAAAQKICVGLNKSETNGVTADLLAKALSEWAQATGTRLHEEYRSFVEPDEPETDIIA